MTASVQKALAQSWLLLVHQLPAQPAYLRVKIWRRLQALGAIPIKNAVHALPMNEGTQEDFEWLLREIGEGGGEAVLCEARLINGISDDEVRRLFDQARNAAYEEIAKEALAITKSLRPGLKPGALSDLRSQIARLRNRLADLTSIDFFGAIGRQKAEAALGSLETRLNEEDGVKRVADQPKSNAIPGLAGKTWVTREGVHIDRIASAWLIRRFIDPQVQFKFVSGKGYRPQPNELRFDMFEAEYTHEGDKCTFEVLLDRAGLKDAGLRSIAEIIHDVDLKDNKFGREEAAGIRTLIDGIAMTTTNDLERIDRGTGVFNDLYEYFRRKRR
ncbi:MAG: chromate resistance protein ChrB domain-containing protein [Candidatus Sulfotelmatobacter sp.]